MACDSGFTWTKSYFRSKNNINNSIKYAIIKNNSINLNQSNNFCLNALKNKDLVCTKSLQTA